MGRSSKAAALWQTTLLAAALLVVTAASQAAAEAMPADWQSVEQQLDKDAAEAQIMPREVVMRHLVADTSSNGTGGSQDDSSQPAGAGSGSDDSAAADSSPPASDSTTTNSNQESGGGSTTAANTGVVDGNGEDKVPAAGVDDTSSQQGSGSGDTPPAGGQDTSSGGGDGSSSGTNTSGGGSDGTSSGNNTSSSGSGDGTSSGGGNGTSIGGDGNNTNNGGGDGSSSGTNTSGGGSDGTSSGNNNSSSGSGDGTSSGGGNGTSIGGDGNNTNNGGGNGSSGSQDSSSGGQGSGSGQGGDKAPAPAATGDFGVQEGPGPKTPPPKKTPSCPNGGAFPLCNKAPVPGPKAVSPSPKVPTPAPTPKLTPVPTPSPKQSPTPAPTPKLSPSPYPKPVPDPLPPTPAPKPSPSPSPSPSPTALSPPPTPVASPSPPPQSPPPAPPPPSPVLAPPPFQPNILAAGFANFSYSVLSNLPQYTAQVQQSVAAQLASQVGVQANQVSLTTPYFPVSSKLTASGYPAGYDNDVKMALIYYLGVDQSAANITLLSSSSGSRRRLRAETATMAVVIKAATGAQAVAVQNKLSDSKGMTDAMSTYLRTRAPLGTGFSALSTQPDTAAFTNVNVTLTAADVATSKQSNVQSAATSSNMRSLLTAGGMPENTLVSILSTPLPPSSPSPAPASPSPAPSSPPPSNAGGGGGGIPTYVWGIVGGCAGVAIVAAAFIAFVCIKRKPKRRAAAAHARLDKKPSQQRQHQMENGALMLKEDDYLGPPPPPPPRGGADGAVALTTVAVAAAAVPLSATAVAVDREASPTQHPREPPLQQQQQQAAAQVHDVDDDGTPMPLSITADEAHLFQLGSRLPAEQEAQVKAAAAAAALKRQLESTAEEAGSEATAADAPAEITPRAAAPTPLAAPPAALATTAAPAAGAAGTGAAVAAGAAAGVVAGAAGGGMLGGFMRRLGSSKSSSGGKELGASSSSKELGSRSGSSGNLKELGGSSSGRSSREREAAAREAAAVGGGGALGMTVRRSPDSDPSMQHQQPQQQRPSGSSPQKTPRMVPHPSFGSSNEILPDGVMATPITLPPLILHERHDSTLSQDHQMAYQMGMQAGVAAALKSAGNSPEKQLSARRQSSRSHSRSNSVTGDRPPRPRRQGSFSNASAYETAPPRKAGSSSGGTRSENGSEAHRPRGFAPGEEEESDEWPLGSVEKAPAALRQPGVSVVQAFHSDRQKHETANAEGILTKIVIERTAHLKSGTQFIKSFWMTEGVRATNTSVVRNAVHKVNKQPVSIKFYGRMEDFNRERQLYSLAISPQFVPMMYFCEEGSEDLPPFIITERGDFTLAEVLTKSRPPPQQQKILLHDVACALSQLHSMGLVQMDIRPANIMFFGKEGAWKLVDFENWAWAGQLTDVSYALRYTSPEIPSVDLAGEATIGADGSMDLFALGILAWEVMTGKRFYGDASDAEVLMMLMGHKLLPSEGEQTVLAQINDKNAQRLLRHLIRRNSAARWDAAKVASCQWFKTSDFQAYRVTG